MDWSGWKTALELWLKTPELIAGTIIVVLAVGGFAARLAWKYRDHTATQREANLRDTAVQREANLQNSITFLEGRLRECREDLSDAKGELREAVRQAKDDQQRMAKEVEELRRENSALRSTTEQINDQIIIIAERTRPPQGEYDEVIKWVRSARERLAFRSDTIDKHLNALSTANTALEGTLSDLSKRLEVTEPSDDEKKSEN